MLKNILNIEGAQKLTSVEQKSITGGNVVLAVCKECNAGDCDNVAGLPTCIKKLHLL